MNTITAFRTLARTVAVNAKTYRTLRVCALMGARLKAAYDRSNNAVNSGTITVLNNTFWNDHRTIRYGQAENLYGYKEIEGFRAASRPLNPPRTLSKTVITTYGRDYAVASTLTYRANDPGRVGRQMQTWVRFPDGWHVVAAHVSTIDAPK